MGSTLFCPHDMTTLRLHFKKLDILLIQISNEVSELHIRKLQAENCNLDLSKILASGN